MMRSIFTAAAFSLAIVSAAWALPVPQASQMTQSAPSDVIQVGHGHGGGKNWNNKNWNNKNWNNKNWNNKRYYGNRYYYGGRSWGHRYGYRPYGWQTLGCIAVGPVWYCP